MERSKLIARGASLGILASMVMLGSALYAGEGNEQQFNGSIEVARGADYAKLARISVIGVKRSIEKRYPKSTIKSIRLQEENGYLVYEVLLLNKGRNLDVKVDAGNGKVLSSDNGGYRESEGAYQDEGRSETQVQENENSED
jgi:uncharacterized membrane protein YkoI